MGPRLRGRGDGRDAVVAMNGRTAVAAEPLERSNRGQETWKTYERFSRYKEKEGRDKTAGADEPLE